MIKKLISSKRVIAKVYRDLDIRDSAWEVNGIEWIGECLNLLDVWMDGYATSKEITVASHKAILPIHWKSTIDVWRKKDDGKFVPMVYSSEDEQGKIIEMPEDARPWSYWQNIDVLVTTFEKGTVFLRYYRQCVDSEGYPLIPDSQNFLEAATWWIIYKMFMRKYQHPDPNMNLQFAYQMYEKYLGQARREIKFPTLGELEELVRNWTGISVEETDYKLFASSPEGNKVYPGFGYVDYGTSTHVNAINTPEFLHIHSSQD